MMSDITTDISSTVSDQPLVDEMKRQKYQTDRTKKIKRKNIV